MSTFLRMCHSPTKKVFSQRLVLLDSWARKLRVPAFKSHRGLNVFSGPDDISTQPKKTRFFGFAPFSGPSPSRIENRLFQTKKKRPLRFRHSFDCHRN